jgi:hypothetical protein
MCALIHKPMKLKNEEPVKYVKRLDQFKKGCVKRYLQLVQTFIPNYKGSVDSLVKRSKILIILMMSGGK